jgi:hypothetical protein
MEPPLLLLTPPFSASQTEVGTFSPIGSICLELIRIMQGFCVSHVLTSPFWRPTITRKNGESSHTTKYCQISVFIKPASYSNYGGISVKAEYSHEVVSSLFGSQWRVMIKQLGSSAGPSHHFDLRSALRSIHSTTSVLVNRLLRAIVRKSTDGAH